jgi:diacylglycerol kinase family enzyme
MRITVIVNRGAGSVTSGDVSADGLRRSFLELGTEADVRIIPGEEIVPTAREAVAGGAEAVVAGGGDGTIRSVASVLAGGAVPLGVLPLGTLNHFARDLQIPTELDQAVRVVATGEVRTLDLGEVNGEVFVNNSVLGFYPPVVRVRDWERRKFHRNKWLATLSAAFKVIPKMPALDVCVRTQDVAVRRTSHFVFVGNNEYQMNAFSYGARNRLDSGSLYLYIAKSPTRLRLLWLTLLSLVRDLGKTEGFDSWVLPEFTIETPANSLPVYLDGEVTSMQPPLKYRTCPRNLRVILPGPTASESP